MRHRTSKLIGSRECGIPRGWALAARLVVLAACAGTLGPRLDAVKAEVKPDRGAVKASDAALSAAIDALEKEVLDHAVDPRVGLRAKCDYFVKNPPRGPIFPEAIVEALGVTYSADPPSDSYVKWQLLSGAPAKFEGELARLAAIAYLDAPKPVSRPGLGAADKKELDALAKDVKTADDAAALSAKLAALVKPWEERNAPVLAYRDALYARLPRGGEALVARLEDDARRVEAGYESEVEMKATTDAIEAWIDIKPPASHLRGLTDRTALWMNRLTGKPTTPAPTVPASPASVAGAYGPYAGAGVVKHGKRDAGEAAVFPPTYYDRIEFVPDGIEVVNQPKSRDAPAAGQWKWVAITARHIDAEVLSDLNVTLEHYAKVAAAAEVGKK